MCLLHSISASRSEISCVLARARPRVGSAEGERDPAGSSSASSPPPSKKEPAKPLALPPGGGAGAPHMLYPSAPPESRFSPPSPPPNARTLGAGGDAHVFVLYVPPGGLADVKITLTALSGAPRLAAAIDPDDLSPEILTELASCVQGGADPSSLPGSSPPDCQKVLDEHGMWAILPSGDGGGSATLTIAKDDPILTLCTFSDDECVLYAAVYSTSAAAAYTVVASVAVADMGLVVDTPPSVARPYLFEPALFGPPLPVAGDPIELGVADDYLGCEGPSRGVRGKAALVGRGTCTFVTKALNAQAGGAVAVIVANSLADNFVSMMPERQTPERADGITIPTIMISRDAGLALRAAASVPPLSPSYAPVVLRLHNPDLERDTMLLDGQPQAGELGAAERSLYRFSVEDAAAVSISITALSGEVDVYVAADGDAASPAHFSWKSAKTGSDLVAAAAGQSGFVATGTYSITVVNPTPRTTVGGDNPGGGSSGAASFVLVAATASRPIKLQAGVPTFQMASAGHPRLFRFWPPADGSDTLAITLTPLCPPGGFCLPGDADLCVSRNATALAAAATYLTRATASVCEWSSTEGGASNDLVTINPKEAAAGGPYFIAVYASSETPVYYDLVAQASVFDA